MTSLIQDSCNALVSVGDEVSPRLTERLLAITTWPSPVIITGVGKSLSVAQLGASVLQTTGVHAIAMHATDVVHGGINLVTRFSVPAVFRTVIALSHSGTTTEVITAVDEVKALGCIVVGVTSDAQSPLACKSDVLLTYDCPRDGSRHGTLPTVSTTAQLAWLNVIACAHADEMTLDELAQGHPGGALGKKYDSMITDNIKSEED